MRTELTTSSVATDDGFEDNDFDVWAGIVDIYFQDDFKGGWPRPGLERWTGEVTEGASGLRQGYATTILTLGGGYTWRFSKHLYLDPWAAVHFPIGGDREVEFSSSTFSIDPTPEASVKIGLMLQIREAIGRACINSRFSRRLQQAMLLAMNRVVALPYGTNGRGDG